MAIHQVQIEGNANWFSIEIRGDGRWVVGEGIRVVSTGARLRVVFIEASRVMIEQSDAEQTTTVTVFLEAAAPSLAIHAETGGGTAFNIICGQNRIEGPLPRGADSTLRFT
jgi:hypothetical protein